MCMAALLCILLLFGFPPPKKDIADAALRLEARYRPTKTLQAIFLERYSENGEVIRVESGKAYFRKPGKMRWEYEKPERDLFLVDGKTAWFYVPGDHTVTRIPAKQSSDLRTPLALLAGEMKISRLCTRVEISDALKPQVQGNALLRCTLRGEGQGKDGHGEANPTASDEVFFEVATGSGDLARIIIRHPGGIEVEFRFQNWEFDPRISADLFRFEPPAGVAIVNGELPSGDKSMKAP
jgi:outer membrane lipoprotein carrier protein